ncbi:hypothetical protein [Agrobacterium salinitolerans]|uniref:hypothetical protein n=1 Tax=Agrobacterium salinitolerans TaxID=1183413 RepID=UPI0035AE2655
MPFYRSFLEHTKSQRIASFDNRIAEIQIGDVRNYYGKGDRINVAEFDGRAYDFIILHDPSLTSGPLWRHNLYHLLKKIRLGTTLSILFRESEFVTVFTLKRFIEQNRRALIVRESRQDGEYYLLVLQLEDSPVKADFSNITFGICTNGSNQQSLNMCLNSILSVQGLKDISFEILVTCPSEKFDPEGVLGKNYPIRAVDIPNEADSLGLIGLKKNKLVQASQYNTVVVLHDRIFLSVDFLDIIKKYTDMDVIVPKVALPNGARLPDWVSYPSTAMWVPPCYVDYDDFSDFYYINGPLLVARRQVLVDVPWSNLIAWNQAEDIDLSNALRNRGIVPLLTSGVGAVSGEVRPGIIDMQEIKALGSERYQYCLPEDLWIDLSHESVQSESMVIEGRSFTNFRFKLRDGEQGRRGCVAIKFAAPLAYPSFELALNGQSTTAVAAGDQLLVPYSSQGRSIHVAFDRDALGEIVAFKFEPGDVFQGGRLTLGKGDRVPTGSLDGWYPQESLGVWSRGSGAKFHFSASETHEHWSVSFRLNRFGHLPASRVKVFCNGKFQGNFTISDRRRRYMKFYIRVPRHAKTRLQTVSFSLDAIVPAREVLAQEHRDLGIFMTAINIKKASMFATKFHSLCRKLGLGCKWR